MVTLKGNLKVNPKERHFAMNPIKPAHDMIAQQMSLEAEMTVMGRDRVLHRHKKAAEFQVEDRTGYGLTLIDNLMSKVAAGIATQVAEREGGKAGRKGGAFKLFKEYGGDYEALAFIALRHIVASLSSEDNLLKQGRGYTLQAQTVTNPYTGTSKEYTTEELIEEAATSEVNAMLKAGASPSVAAQHMAEWGVDYTYEPFSNAMSYGYISLTEAVAKAGKEGPKIAEPAIAGYQTWKAMANQPRLRDAHIKDAGAGQVYRDAAALERIGVPVEEALLRAVSIDRKGSRSSLSSNIERNQFERMVQQATSKGFLQGTVANGGQVARWIEESVRTQMDLGVPMKVAVAEGLKAYRDSHEVINGVAVNIRDNFVPPNFAAVSTEVVRDYAASAGLDAHEAPSDFREAQRMLRDYNFSRIGGQLGIAQMGDFGNILGAGGMRRLMQALPALRSIFVSAKTGKFSDDLFNEIEAIWGFGTDTVRVSPHVKMDDIYGGTFEGRDYGSTKMQFLDHSLQRGKMVTSVASGMAHVNMVLQRLNGRVIVQRFLDDAVGSRPINQTQLMRFETEHRGFRDMVGIRADCIDAALAGWKRRGRVVAQRHAIDTINAFFDITQHALPATPKETPMLDLKSSVTTLIDNANAHNEAGRFDPREVAYLATVEGEAAAPVPVEVQKRLALEAATAAEQKLLDLLKRL